MKKNKIFFIIWGIFLLFLLAQYHLVYLYYDDFGFFSLTYGYDAEISGTKMNWNAIWDYIIHSYTLVSGRISVILAYTLLGWLGGLNTVRILLPITILLIFLHIYLIIVDQKSNNKIQYFSLIFLCFSYGLFGIQICNTGLYWFAATYVYVIPVVFFLIFDRLYQYNKTSAPIVSFFLCLFSELMVSMSLSYIILNIGNNILRKENVGKNRWLSLFTSIAAMFIMLMSPASRGRMSNGANISFYNMNLYEKIVRNSNIIINHFFFRISSAFVWFVLIICMLMAATMIKKNKFKIFYIFYSICTSVIMYLFATERIKSNIEIHVFLFLFYFIFLFIGLFIYFINWDFHIASIVAGTSATIGILLIVPEIPIRTFIPCIFMFILFGGKILTEYLNAGRGVLVYILMIPFIIVNSQNLQQIYKGYQSNVEILEYNAFKLTEASEQLKNGQNIQIVELYKIPQPIFAGPQVYSNEVAYMKFWIDQYYELPYTIEYIYYDYPSKENAISICHVK